MRDATGSGQSCSRPFSRCNFHLAISNFGRPDSLARGRSDRLQARLVRVRRVKNRTANRAIIPIAIVNYVRGSEADESGLADGPDRLLTEGVSGWQPVRDLPSMDSCSGQNARICGIGEYSLRRCPCDRAQRAAQSAHFADGTVTQCDDQGGKKRDLEGRTPQLNAKKFVARRAPRRR